MFSDCAVCGSSSWCTSDCNCFGCELRAKNHNIAGATVAGSTYGRQPLILTDTARDQRVDAMQQWNGISHRMQTGGAVAEDALQQPCEQQLNRIKATDDRKVKPLDAWSKLEKSAVDGKPVAA